MGVRGVVWAVFLGGLPFAHLLNREIDLWHAQTAWSQLWILVLFGMTWWSGTRPTLPNRPLAVWIGWVGFSTLYLWMNTLQNLKMYNLVLLMPLFHNLMFVFFVWAAVQSWSHQSLRRLTRWIARSGLVLLAYCALQQVGLDQFFRQLDGGADLPLVGTIGNPSHLAAQLALLLPIFLLQSGKRWKGAAAAAGVLIVLTGSTAGMLCGYLALLWCAFFWERRLYYALSVVGGLGLCLILTSDSLMRLHGRPEAWTALWAMFTERPITGMGPGFLMQYSQGVTEVGHPLFHWRHAHNEYLQLLVEYGVIGLAIMGWLVGHTWNTFWRLPKSREAVALGGILLVFLVNCLVNFPAHLWLTASLALVAYCGLHVLNNESVYAPDHKS